MKVRTFLLFVLLLAGLLLLASLLDANREVLEQPILLWGDMSLPVGIALVACLGLGILITFVIGLSREAGLLIERGRLRREGRKYEEVEEEYSRGLVADVEGREEEALGHFRAVLERDSRHFNTLIKIGEVLRGQGRIAEAIEFHRKAHHLKEDNSRPLYALVDDHEAQGDIDRARVVLGRILGIQKNSIAAWRKLRSLHMTENNWDQALEAHQKVEKLAPDAGHDPRDQGVGQGIRYEIASARLEQGKSREAAGLLKRLIKDNPQFIPAHVALGEALLSQGNESEATDVWFNGFETTGSPIFLTMLEEHYLQNEEPLRAIEALKRCTSQARKDTLARFYLGKLYFRLEMLDDALSVLNSLDGLASYAPTLHYLLGRIHERRGQFRDAAVDYRKVIKETDLVQLEYGCRRCDESLMTWAGRCPECGAWNSVEVNFREEIPLEELGLAPAPIYTTRD
jgi:lipopolysaccharide biosynthesis regulator YciM